MTRRFVVLMVGLVVTTLLIAGLGTLVLASVRARGTTEDSLRQQAVDLSSSLGQLFVGSDSDTLTPVQERARLRQLTVLRRVLDLDGFAVLTLNRAGGVLTADELPSALNVDVIDLDLMRAGGVQTGHVRDLVFAAAPLQLPNSRTGVIVLSQEANAGLGPAARYFALAAILTALLGLLAAMVAGRRFTQPIRAASLATTRIAAGELSTRLPEPRADQTDELAELSRNVNTMAESLERARTLEQQFLLSVSHDLRTPLTSIRGYAEALADGTVDAARSAAIIKSEARRLERLVADLLDLAKVQASTFSMRSERIDLSQLAIVAGEGFEPDAIERNLTLVVQPWPALLMVSADHDRLAQVAANLIENALKYAARTVHLSTVVDRGWAVLTVRDDGPGIAADDVPHVFERLYVARHQPTRAESSSGLGLAIVQQLITAMGGQVWVTSEPGAGTTFGVRLPLVS
ncbi:MAG: signal transduction histidine kinase [Ilumatobacteraceae bacterium]|nr:signal transduction histidine kinase [Ilumatobacteraceae bacterium]